MLKVGTHLQICFEKDCPWEKFEVIGKCASGAIVSREEVTPDEVNRVRPRKKNFQRLGVSFKLNPRQQELLNSGATVQAQLGVWTVEARIADAA